MFGKQQANLKFLKKKDVVYYRPKVFVKPLQQLERPKSQKKKPLFSSQPRPMNDFSKQNEPSIRLMVQRPSRPETISILPKK